MLDVLTLANIANDDHGAPFHLALVKRGDRDADVDPLAVFGPEDALFVANRGTAKHVAQRPGEDGLGVDILERVDRLAEDLRLRVAEQFAHRVVRDPPPGLGVDDEEGVGHRVEDLARGTPTGHALTTMAPDRAPAKAH